MNPWSNIEILDQDQEITGLDKLENNLDIIPPLVKRIRELITRFEVCHSKYKKHLNYIEDSIINLDPAIDPDKIGENHIRNGENAWINDKTGRSLAGQQYLWSLSSWLRKKGQRKTTENNDSKLESKISKWLGNKADDKERLVKLLIARLTYDWESYEKLQVGEQFKELEYQACRMDICHYAFPDHLNALIQATGKMHQSENYRGMLLPGDSVIKGVKQIQGNKLIPFLIRKVSDDKLAFKIPGTDRYNQPSLKYRYNTPTDTSDGFMCASLEDVGMDTTRICALINKILTEEIPNIHSLLILKDNKLVLEEYFYNYTPDMPHRIHSVTKSITSALTGIAIDKNFIPDINEPVWKYFTRWDKSKWVSQRYDIGIKHLLGMTAGLDWKSLTLNESNDDIDMYKTDDYFGFLLNKNQKFSPGTNFCYNNGLSLMLGYIIGKASGMPVDNFSKEFLFKDLAITNYSWDIDANGTVRMDGGLKMRPGDMLKFGKLYLNEGNWNGKQLISGNWILNSTTQQINLGDRGYAYHWWNMDYNVNGKIFRFCYALGHGEQAIVLVPEVKMVFVMTAGNYMQVEHRPFEIMSQYILPSLKRVDNSVDLSLF